MYPISAPSLPTSTPITQVIAFDAVVKDLQRLGCFVAPNQPNHAVRGEVGESTTFGFNVSVLFSRAKAPKAPFVISMVAEEIRPTSFQSRQLFRVSVNGVQSGDLTYADSRSAIAEGVAKYLGRRWDTSQYLDGLMTEVAVNYSPRKLRLAAVAIVREVLKVAEPHLDPACTGQVLRFIEGARIEAYQGQRQPSEICPDVAPNPSGPSDGRPLVLARHLAFALGCLTFESALVACRTALDLGRLNSGLTPEQLFDAPAVFRSIVDNPHDPISVEPQWRTAAVMELANRIRNGQRFDLLPSLAELLEIAHCDSYRVLTHCRADAPRHDGDVVVDKLIGLS